MIVFDFDGVLVDSEFIRGQVTCKHLLKYGVKTDLDTTLKRYVGMYDSERRLNLAKDIGEAEVDAFIVETKQLSLKAYGQKLAPLKNVIEMLDQLTLPFCIASNSQFSSLKAKLKITQLERFFDDDKLFVGSMVNKPKPAPDLYILAAKTFGVTPSDCLVVEDSVHGINAAVAANMNVVGFVGASHCYKNYDKTLLNAGAKMIFSDMAELKNLISLV